MSEASTSTAIDPALDGVRGVAILAVLVYHFDENCPGIVRIHAPLGERIFTKIASMGWAGVDLFFVLSGYLITRALLRAKGRANYFRSFYARRALRIFPIHYLVLAVVLVAMPSSREDALWYATFTSNAKIAVTGFGASAALGHFWSLAVEVQLYALWPLAVRRLGERRLAGLCCSLCVVSLALRCVLTLAGQSAAAYVATPARMDAFMFGALVALAAPNAALLRRIATVALVALAFIVLWRRSLYQYDGIVATAGFTLIAIASASVVGIVTSRPGGLLADVLSTPTLRFFGKYSYALYAVHYPLLFAIPNGFRVPRLWGSQLPGEILFIVMATAVCVVVALLAWHLVEKRALALKSAFA